ncbi:major facilitator superfamily transporter [Fusarium denticulatum]|uniref:Major facilitator superfamily transporter n=1 Tax=Fusarium denticulatum TaxID=48507 RepID=A0A8H5T5D0_9HYPO|nr:major facilitator superfamily transporter [Fusarium denticulatum]
MIFVAYFFFPETKGVPLEEMAAIFGDEVEYETSGIQVLETSVVKKKDEVVLGVTHDEFSQQLTHTEYHGHWRLYETTD